MPSPSTVGCATEHAVHTRAQLYTNTHANIHNKYTHTRAYRQTETPSYGQTAKVHLFVLGRTYVTDTDSVMVAEAFGKVV